MRLGTSRSRAFASGLARLGSLTKILARLAPNLRHNAEKLKPHGRFPAQKQEKIPNHTFHVGGGRGDSTWIRNSGALRWYTWDKSIFVNFKPIMDGKEEYCHRVTGDGAKIEGMGSVVYEATLSNGFKTKITWQEVYYVPTFKVKITSTVETSLKGINKQVDGNVCCFIYQGKEIMCAHLVQNRWVMQIWPVMDKSDSIHIIGSTDNNKIWHHSYGHLSERTLNMTQKHIRGLVLNPIKWTHVTTGLLLKSHAAHSRKPKNLVRK
jgi:hypothetical protein